MTAIGSRPPEWDSMDEVERRLLEQRFHEAMLDIYALAGRASGYWAGYFLRTVRARGGIGTARYLLGLKGTSAGFERLRKEGRLDLSVEALVLRPEFRPLFTAAELETARTRLARYGQTPDAVDVDIAQPSPALIEALDRVDAATPVDRMVHRDGIVGFGAAGREAMRRWLLLEHHTAFAISVLEKLAAGDRSAAGALESYAMNGGRDQRLATAALDHLRSH